MKYKAVFDKNRIKTIFEKFLMERNLIFQIFLFFYVSFAGYMSKYENDDLCIPFGTACTSGGLAHLYSQYHFNGRYHGDERMRIPFSIVLNASIPGAI